ncbi:MAG TPA: bifunctional tetrahydrofolate synthase/dihydrofolate synthase [Solimonas sp.]|nr:bifunctional tetrahydrofolate synthase/dihydrofolate synthase [Solimonas sp.]
MAAVARSLEDWLRWQETLHPKVIALGLERVREVALRLGVAQGPAVTLTVGGTNGKGSSATLAADIYEAAGYPTGLYTSPHLLHYRERIRIDGVPADDASLCRAFAAVEAARGEVALTYFEFGTLAALWLFREAGVQVQVLEVGLGGRLDAVNLVDADAALLTNVGLDHQDWLGPDRESIGREKAGIFRAGRPAVIAEREPPQSVQRALDALGAHPWRLGRDYDYVADAQGGWTWSSRTTTWSRLPAPGLAGAIQIHNAAGVLAAVAALQERRPVTEEAVRRALPRLRLPGRCERIGSVLLDVAHNLESAEVLAEALAAQQAPPVQLVLGMLADKPVAEVARRLAPRVAQAWLVGLPGPRGLSAGELSQRIDGCGFAAECCDNMRQAMDRARMAAGPAGLVLVTGSFLTVAEARQSIDG